MRKRSEKRTDGTTIPGKAEDRAFLFDDFNSLFCLGKTRYKLLRLLPHLCLLAAHHQMPVLQSSRRTGVCRAPLNPLQLRGEPCRRPGQPDRQLLESSMLRLARFRIAGLPFQGAPAVPKCARTQPCGWKAAGAVRQSTDP